FFFSSRRRHTRCYRDWSSDVCSSDLERLEPDGELAELFRCDLLAEASEAYEIGEAHGHLARAGQLSAPALQLADHLALRGMHEMQRQHVADERVDHRVEHRDRPRVAPGEIAFAQPW